jgi:hypothetical protein
LLGFAIIRANEGAFVSYTLCEEYHMFAKAWVLGFMRLLQFFLAYTELQRFVCWDQFDTCGKAWIRILSSFSREKFAVCATTLRLSRIFFKDF